VGNEFEGKCGRCYDLPGFVEYQLNRRWHFKLNVNNVLDETFVVGAQHAAAIDPSQPRTFSLIATLRF
jgi:outer membrane receptor for monomeric catechols